MAKQKLTRKHLSADEKEQLLRQWEPLCLSLVSRLMKRDSRTKWFEFEDALQEARMFLLDAAALYDPKRAKEITYYTSYVWGKLRSWLRYQTFIHIPTYLLDNRERARRMPHYAEFIGFAQDAMRVVQPPEEPFGDDRGSWAGAGAECEEPDLDEERLVTAAIAELPDSLRLVIRERFGMCGRNLTHRALGVDMGISYERVRQLERKALVLLRKRLEVTA